MGGIPTLVLGGVTNQPIGVGARMGGIEGKACRVTKSRQVNYVGGKSFSVARTPTSVGWVGFFYSCPSGGNQPSRPGGRLCSAPRKNRRFESPCQPTGVLAVAATKPV